MGKKAALKTIFYTNNCSRIRSRHRSGCVLQTFMLHLTFH